MFFEFFRNKSALDSRNQVPSSALLGDGLLPLSEKYEISNIQNKIAGDSLTYDDLDILRDAKREDVVAVLNELAKTGNRKMFRFALDISNVTLYPDDISVDFRTVIEMSS